MNPRLMLCQFLAALIFALVAGSVFGIWRGYDPTLLTPTAFVEMHQGAVRGLNVLLPALGFASIGLTVVLIWSARDKGFVFWLYLSALLFMAAAGITTRFFNQPINALVMGWAVETLPAGWSELRAQWWNWHLWRTAFSIAALALLLAAIVLDRPSRP
ncbi:DUF1772 domain-containing protein [Chelativorans sp. ZYF759]|uniref:anthrone oxygenase family protein n=1 Tax=Chelativorans sp. ZYF759 TaxID=2692213 RepID=UPI00145EE58C|nr:DUF1772 domain-containing protein [Chelativorans sp. ZYF759]NMG38854.1 DUF1772 domain-containing protein [Chelativorans sp. ZYF759]